MINYVFYAREVITPIVILAVLAPIFLIIQVTPANASCRDYPESVTPACVAQNLAEQQAYQAAEEARLAKQIADAEKRAQDQAQEDFIRNGSRPCSLYPASITAECAAANLAYEETKKIEIAALTEARETSTKSLITTKDENGSLLVASNIPEGVDLLTTKVRLLNSKGKLIDNGEIRYDSAGRPYFVFAKQVNKGNYKIQLTIPKKKAATIRIKF